jgi:hypothetical protein
MRVIADIIKITTALFFALYLLLFVYVVRVV